MRNKCEEISLALDCSSRNRKQKRNVLNYIKSVALESKNMQASSWIMYCLEILAKQDFEVSK